MNRPVSDLKSAPAALQIATPSQFDHVHSTSNYRVWSYNSIRLPRLRRRRVVSPRENVPLLRPHPPSTPFPKPRGLRVSYSGRGDEGTARDLGRYQVLARSTGSGRFGGCDSPSYRLRHAKVLCGAAPFSGAYELVGETREPRLLLVL